jgi:aminoglycoside 6'-N-acetyltransferase I
MSVRRLQCGDFNEWSRMRRTLWPHVTLAECRKELEAVRRTPSRSVIFVSKGHDGVLHGFIEASLRRDYVEGCTSSPVGCIEGWYVIPDARRKGIGRELVRTAERWARAKGCNEMASDAELANELSQTIHRSLGYRKCGTCVHFRKPLRR